MKFAAGANIHFGWVRLSLDTLDPTGLKLTIHDFAYNADPDQPINAGDAPGASIIAQAALEDKVTIKITLDKITLNRVGSTPRSNSTPKPQPSPTSTDFKEVPEIGSGSIIRLTESTGEAIFWARGFNSYRIYVTKKSDPSSKPIFDTGYVNDYKYPIKVTITNLTCSRDLLAVATLYSGLDGKGLSWSDPSQSSQLSAVELQSDGKCNFGVSPP